jgi:uncharacterized membrane protein
VLTQRLGDSTSEPALDPRPPERPPPRSLRGLLAVAGGLTLLVAIVAAASRGERVAPERGGGASDAVRDYLLSTYMVVGVVVFVTIMFFLVKERESLQTKRSKHRDVRQLLQFALVMLVLVVAGPYIWKAFRGERDDAPPTAAPTAGEVQRERDRAARERDARFRWEPLVALGALGAISLAVLVGRRARRREDSSDRDMAEALAAVLDDALADLLAERDLRRATIAAYARMERLLAARDIGRRPSEAPFEYLSRVLLELDASAAAVFELTALFERAKFSRHTIDEGMRDEAIAALRAVRDELRSGP